MLNVLTCFFSILLIFLFEKISKVQLTWFQRLSLVVIYQFTVSYNALSLHGYVLLDLVYGNFLTFFYEENFTSLEFADVYIFVCFHIAQLLIVCALAFVVRWFYSR